MDAGDSIVAMASMSSFILNEEELSTAQQGRRAPARARAALFLGSGESSYCTDTSLVGDRGVTIR